MLGFSFSCLTAWGGSCFERWCADGVGAREGKGKEGNRRDRKGKEGKGRERKGQEGKGRERKGKDGKGRERTGKEGKEMERKRERERKGTEGTGKERKGKEGKGRERKGKKGKERERKGKEGKGRERKGKEGKGRERKGKEGKGREGKERLIWKSAAVAWPCSNEYAWLLRPVTHLFCAQLKKFAKFPLHVSEVDLEISRPRMTVLKWACLAIAHHHSMLPCRAEKNEICSECVRNVHPLKRCWQEAKGK